MDDYRKVADSIQYLSLNIKQTETLGPWGPEARALLKELSKRVIESTGDPRAGSSLANELVWPSKGAMLTVSKELCLAAVVSRTF
ncbi:jg2286 [Pararge aegeria aegeria]|uniref:Jg2286 protein n=1 Tax=Pararge aegeria aegeria TaxID=348720 RepID=A0A8S4RT97_9NEOP|nr:jg2286 [Pararge aegeria aegeria]